jgi:hypothetical protein
MFEAEVVVQVAGEMFLDAEEPLASFRLRHRTFGLRRLPEVPLALVFFESH